MFDAPRLIRALAIVVAAAFAPRPVSVAEAGGTRPVIRVKGKAKAPRAPKTPRTPAAPHVNASRSSTPRHHNSGAGARRSAPRGNTNRSSGPDMGPSLTGLRSALGGLAKSELDYKGHRSRAMNEVGSAILHLQPQSSGVKPTNPALAYANAAGAVGNSTMTRAASDAHLRDALASLKRVDSHLSSVGVNARHGRAKASVEKAVNELNSALALNP